MPERNLKPCGVRGCPNLTRERYCTEHIKIKDSRKNSSERGYGHRWRKYRLVFLKQHPFCTECLKKGIHTAASVVDHIIPHKGNQTLFWDSKNHQALCKGCHDIKTVKYDGGFGYKKI